MNAVVALQTPLYIGFYLINYVTDTENFPYGVVFVKHILFNNCFTMEYLAQIVFLWHKYFFFAIQIDIIVTNVSERHMSTISTTREHFLKKFPQIQCITVP